jgi:hypothetical protein
MLVGNQNSRMANSQPYSGQIFLALDGSILDIGGKSKFPPFLLILISHRPTSDRLSLELSELTSDDIEALKS